MSVQDFRSKLIGGGARPNQFRVSLNFPGGITGGSEAASSAAFLCEAASLPGQSVEVLPVMFRGREVKLAGERRFDNWQITIINDIDFVILRAIESWSNMINNLTTNSGETEPLSYVANLDVQQLSRDINNTDGGIKKYTFKNAWPTAVSPIQLSFGDNNNISKFTVDFAYDYYELVF